MNNSKLGLIRERWPYLLISALLVIGDRVTKSLVQQALDSGERRVVVDGLLDLIHLRNTGVAFGIFSGSDSSSKALVLAGAAIAAAVCVVIYSVRLPARDVLLQSALSLILAGAVGNLYDRLNYGYVIDFLYFHLGSFYWPAFNLADTAITLGVGLLGVDIIRHEIRDRR